MQGSEIETDGMFVMRTVMKFETCSVHHVAHRPAGKLTLKMNTTTLTMPPIFVREPYNNNNIYFV